MDIITPFGTALWPFLSRPSFKFSPTQGEFSVKLRLAPGPETDEFIAQLAEAYEASYEKNLALAQIEKPKTTEIKRADPPYRPATDDEGAEIGGYDVGFRLKHRYFPKDGKPFTKRPLLVDAKGNPLTEEIGAGTVLRVSGTLSDFFTPSIGSGISLRLKGVQVKELVGPEGSAETMGFDQVEGFESSGERQVEETFDAPPEPGEPEAAAAPGGLAEDF